MDSTDDKNMELLCCDEINIILEVYSYYQSINSKTIYNQYNADLNKITSAIHSFCESLSIIEDIKNKFLKEAYND